MAQPMTRILIVGSPGSGKSTLAVRLGRALSLPVVHLDRLYWRAGWRSVPNEEFDRQLEAVLAQDAFLIDGNYARSLARRVEQSQAVILLDLGRVACVLRALRRILLCYGRTRPDMGDGCPERFDRAFLKYIWTFPSLILPETLETIAAHPGVRLIRLRSRRACRAFLKQVQRENGIY